MADLTSTEIKLATAKQKKDSADQAFKQGDTKAALMSYHQALMFLLGLDKNALQSIGVGPSATSSPSTSKAAKDVKEKTEIDDIIEKIYANMAACHLKNQNWQRVIETADKALAKNENNYKALFRKGKALGAQGFYEKAVKILKDVKEKNPSDGPAVDAELARLKVIDDERERAHKQKMKGFLNKEKKSTPASEGTPAADLE